MFDQAETPNIEIPNAIAGLNTPPEIPPTAYAPTTTVNPIARPQCELPAVPFAVATFSTTNTSANVNRNSATSAGSVLNVIGAVAAPAFRNFTTSAASAA